MIKYIGSVNISIDMFGFFGRGSEWLFKHSCYGIKNARHFITIVRDIMLE